MCHRDYHLKLSLSYVKLIIWIDIYIVDKKRARPVTPIQGNRLKIEIPS